MRSEYVACYYIEDNVSQLAGQLSKPRQVEREGVGHKENYYAGKVYPHHHHHVKPSK